MELSIRPADIDYAETFLAASDLDAARPALERLVEEAGAYIDAVCVTTDSTQWFSFESPFERLAYRRVEDDPRELEQAPAPFDRIYADYGYLRAQQGEWEAARDALMQAVRWNPMNCAHRLNLAEAFRILGDEREWAALSASVIERASDGRSLARAYANLGLYLLDHDAPVAAAACARRAADGAAGDLAATRLAARLAAEHPEAAEVPDERAAAELERQGVPASPNAEIAICLLMCATDAAAAGEADEATRLTVRARDLVGAEAAAALVALIRETDAEAGAAADDAAAAGGDR